MISNILILIVIIQDINEVVVNNIFKYIQLTFTCFKSNNSINNCLYQQLSLTIKKIEKVTRIKKPYIDII